MASGSRDNPLALLQFPFSAGIDEGNRDEIVEPGAGWAVLENGRQDHRGGYSTRPGFTYFSNSRLDATSATAGYKMFADRDTVVRVSDTMYAEVLSTTSGRWVPAGRAPEATYTSTAIPAMGTAQDTVGLSASVEDLEYCNGYIAATYATTEGAYVAIYDAATLATVLAPQVLAAANGTFPQVGSFGTRFVAFVAVTSSTSIFAYSIDTTSAATIAAGWVLLATVGADWKALYGVSVCSLADRVAVAYVNTSAGVSQVSVKTYTAAGVAETATINTSSVTPLMVDIAGSNADTLWIAWDETVSVKACGLTGNSLATVKASTGTIITVATAARGVWLSPSTTGAARLAVTDTATASARTHFRNMVTAATVATGSGAQITSYGAVMASRPFYYNARHYAPFWAGSITGTNATSNSFGNTQRTYIVCDWTDAVSSVRPVANVAPGLAFVNSYTKSKTVATAAGKYVSCCHSIQSQVGQSPALIALDFTSSRRWQPAAAGNSTFLSGGLTAYFDGRRIAEVGFLGRPTKPTGTGGGTGITGTFRYIAVYEEVDADGNWSISGLSDPSDAVVVANKTVTVLTTPLAISARFDSTTSKVGVRVAWYRTATGGSAPYYRHSTVANDPSIANVTLSDSTTDANLTVNAKLYSQPGVIGTSQDKRPPPGFSCIASYNGMLVGAVGSDVWYSGQNVSGEGIWFNPIFQIPIPGSGDITSLWVQDGSLFVAKRRELYAISGEAPSDNGSSGGLGQPRKLAVDVGCIESRSPCTTTFGTFFQSERGIEILTRSQSVEWIGEPIQDTLASYPIVTSATVDPASCTVLIELAASEASGLVAGNGRTLVYDLSLKSWVSCDRRKTFAGVADAPSQAACMIYTGSAYKYAWMGASGAVYYERTASYLDADGTMVAKRAISANVKTGGLQGYQHVNKTLVLARYHTPHDLNLSFAYDYVGTYKTARLYTAAQLLTLTSAIPNMQLEHGMHDDARCEAVRVQLQDVTPSSGTLGTGQGATWIALAFEVVPQTGAYALPDASR